MTEAELEEILKVGEEALENDPYCLCHEHTVASVVDVVGRAVLHAAAERQRRLPIDDPFLAGQRDALAALIDPDRSCDCGELTCPCGCQAGEREPHWIHFRSCNTQKR